MLLKVDKMVWRTLKIANKEFNLENTLVNGQCFNWRKLGHDHFEGVFQRFYVQLRRSDEESVSYFTLPEDSSQA